MNTITPGFFVRYFEHLEELIGSGKELTPEVNRAALMRFATIPLSDDQVEQLEKESNRGIQMAKIGDLTHGVAMDVATNGGADPELGMAVNGGKDSSEFGVSF